MAEDSAILDMEKLKETFFLECAEHVATMESSILEMEENPEDEELMGELFRAAHSLKGNSGCLGYMDINGFTHVLETVLERVKGGELRWSEELTSVMLDSVDATKLLIEAAREEKDCSADVEGTKKRLQDIIGKEAEDEPVGIGQGAAPEKQEKGGGNVTLNILFEPDPEILKRGMDPISKIIEELWANCEVLKVGSDTSRLPALDAMDPEICYLSWNVVVSGSVERSVVEDVFEFVMDDSKIIITELEEPEADKCDSDCGVRTPDAENKNDEPVSRTGAASAAKGEKTQAKGTKMGEATIRVDTEKVDTLVNLVGELLITQAMISQLTDEQIGEKAAPLQRAAVQLKRNTIEMQERVMSIRMLPIGSIFARFRRLVRDLALARGKKIRLDISGEETELDKTVIEKLADPLTHLLRNSVDHGVESPQERLAAGKDEEGLISLNAYHEGGKVMITVSDDGRGLNREKIIRKAVDKGILNEGEEVSEEDANALIFAPGFSTADVISDVSGRGVGMDVVKRNIEEMGGSVGIESYKGEGTRFELRLPLTLAIIQGLTVGIGQEKFIIPITMVLESKRPTEKEVKTVEGSGEVMSFRGNYVPIIRLYKLFNISPLETNPWEAIVVAISVDGKNYGLLVDELIGEQQVVIKGLGALHGIGGIAGATILGDGRVALILDGAGIVKKEYARK
ncbi:Signal transduction histidine kinase CheA [hydrothermal vent metagenome]|uniref:Chemotaxis protein CheA n=1 Tax=hydrothermal vent metagenome TaxID=652676 RepID=A0A3B0QP90_9ZZZZ